jgi:hypothetical protein
MSTSARNLNDLAVKVAQDDRLAEEIRQDPPGALARVAANSAPIPDTKVYRIIVTALGLAVLIALVGAIILVYKDKTNLEVITALGSAAVGALAGLLAPSPVNNQ